MGESELVMRKRDCMECIWGVVLGWWLGRPSFPRDAIVIPLRSTSAASRAVSMEKIKRAYTSESRCFSFIRVAESASIIRAHYIDVQPFIRSFEIQIFLFRHFLLSRTYLHTLKCFYLNLYAYIYSY